MKNKSTLKYFFIILIIIVTYSIISLIANYFSIMNMAYEERKRELINLVDLVDNVFEYHINLVKNDIITYEEAKLRLYDLIQDINYEDSNYIFTLNLNGEVEIPFTKYEKGDNLLNSQDINGKYLIKSFIDIVKNHDEGYLEYYWENPANGQIENKLSYVRIIKELNWFFGTGIYLDDLQKKVNQQFISESIYLLLFLILLIIIIFIVYKKQQKNLKLLLEKINNYSEKNLETDFYINSNDEIELISMKLNKMADNINLLINSLEVKNQENSVLNEKLIENENKLLKNNEELKSANEEMYAINEELEQSYTEINILINKIENLILVMYLNYENVEDFFLNIFYILEQFITEFDYGAILLKKNDKIEFLETIGHDKELLNSIYLNSKKIKLYEEVIEIESLKLYEDKFDEETIKIINKAIKPHRRTLIIPIKSKNKLYGNIGLDISSDKKESEFSRISIDFSKYFASLIQLYLTIQEYNDEINTSYLSFARKLADLAESYDDETGNHILRVGKLAGFIAQKMGLNVKKIKEIEDFAPLHDIGKIYISKEILKKPGKLTSEEWKEMKKHTSYSYRLLGGDKHFETALNISLYHHEKYKGGGYPFNISGEKIPIEASIVSLVDVYDALRSKRPYKEAYTHEESLKIIFDGTQRTKSSDFDPKILKVLKQYEKEIKELWDKLN
ncbi:HD domain-containing protein [Oceanotoga teriensis]|uniref:HD domain-containing protein n=1 Tax=Oceanotoga teriensis TaxID=515440 RepID=A0AA45HIC0_9BACT|nr:HD domain-containing phosphohydrolase [Oceanotoga teriensis]PWJ91252.1 HD domain-containing protein [Oceanotoga teriensis]